MNCNTWGLNAVKIVAAIMLLNGTASAQTYVKYKPNNNWRYVHKDYQLKFGPAVRDTMIIIDPITGDEIMKEIWMWDRHSSSVSHSPHCKSKNDFLQERNG